SKRRYVVQRNKRQLLSEFDTDRERKERQLLDMGCGICPSAFRLQGCTDTARNLYGRSGLQSSAIGRCKKDRYTECRANSRGRLRNHQPERSYATGWLDYPRQRQFCLRHRRTAHARNVPVRPFCPAPARADKSIVGYGFETVPSIGRDWTKV